MSQRKCLVPPFPLLFTHSWHPPALNSTMQQGTEKATAACEQILLRLNTTYIDLALIHFPAAAKLPLDSPLHSHLRRESWRVLESFHRRGVFRAIGISNYEEPRHLEVGERLANFEAYLHKSDSTAVPQAQHCKRIGHARAQDLVEPMHEHKSF
jgi:aryl-alcohol dehydrogenase-like predicted oxidoreductase